MVCGMYKLIMCSLKLYLFLGRLMLPFRKSTVLELFYYLDDSLTEPVCQIWGDDSSSAPDVYPDQTSQEGSYLGVLSVEFCRNSQTV